MPEITNKTRAKWARQALLAFADETGQDLEQEPAEVLGDLLADLRHWAAAVGVEFEVCACNSQAVYEAEKGEENGELHVDMGD